MVLKLKSADGGFHTVEVDDDSVVDIEFGFGSSGLCRLSIEDGYLVIDPWSYGEEA